MPKRSYPFGDGSPLQLKTHVGQKQLCDGVSGDFFKREIFEKTKKLLFSGAQMYMNHMWNGSKAVVNCAIPHSPDHGSENKTGDSCDVNGLLQGQTLIGHDGKLLKGSNVHEKPVPMGVSKACSSCVKSVGDKEACAQCERFICKNCSVLCCCCSAVTCSLCAIVDDGDICEKAFCYGCSLFEMTH
ncbi:apoptosis regulatory protein Siva isoform X2 [Lissotriton helveticus]